jgi:hypothetical protein
LLKTAPPRRSAHPSRDRRARVLIERSLAAPVARILRIDSPGTFSSIRWLWCTAEMRDRSGADPRTNPRNTLLTCAPQPVSDLKTKDLRINPGAAARSGRFLIHFTPRYAGATLIRPRGP